MKITILLLGWSLALPTLAVAQATGTPPTRATAATISIQTSHLEPPPAPLERDNTVPAAQLKKHWWNHVIFFNPFSSKNGPAGDQDTITQYRGLSSRPWASIAGDPLPMSNDMDLMVHRPDMGLGGSY